MNLTPHDLQLLKDILDCGKPLPPKYRPLLFADAPEVKLIWQGKTGEVTSFILPFQFIKQIDEPRSEAAPQQMGLFSVDSASGWQSGGWTNKLIWGNNKLVLSSLKNGLLRVSEGRRLTGRSCSIPSPRAGRRPVVRVKHPPLWAWEYPAHGRRMQAEDSGGLETG